MPRSAAKKIRIERKDDVGFLRAIHRIEVSPKSELGAFTRTVADGRLPLVPLRLRKKRQQRLNLRGKGGRSDNPRQYAETHAVRPFHLGRHALGSIDKQRPRLDFSEFRYRLRAIRIVEV